MVCVIRNLAWTWFASECNEVGINEVRSLLSQQLVAHVYQARFHLLGTFEGDQWKSCLDMSLLCVTWMHSHSFI